MIRILRLALPRPSPDVVLTVGIAFVLGMLVIPLPAQLLDVMLAANMGFAALILVSVMLAERPLSLSTFPTLLLVSTLFRLALNVSTTRMILSTGSAGEVVHAFGQFVLRGDVVVGLVVFLVLTLVQFMVIAKGAERVAEVGARFTLDAMPGKQMSIDADLRNGAINDDQARRLRSEIGRESQFYGAMDGAMKFVKGDAIAGLVITAINLVAGLAIGALRFEMSVAEAAETFASLTVGDGLVSQIPSLLIALASGLLTTRVASGEDEPTSLAGALELELFSGPKALAIASGFCTALALVPGLPTVPFLVIAFGLGLASGLKRLRVAVGPATREEVQAELVRERIEQAKKQRTPVDQMAPSVSLITIELSEALTRAFGFETQAHDKTELLGDLIPQMREAIFLDTGVRIPGARIRTHCTHLRGNRFRVLIKEVTVSSGTIDPERLLAVAAPRRLRRLGLDDIIEIAHPLTQSPCAVVAKTRATELAELGIQTWTGQGFVALSTMARVREHLAEFLGVQEVSDLLEQMKQVYPDLVSQTVPSIISVTQLVDVLKFLVRERISIRDLRSILDAIAAHGDRSPDPEALTEWVRAALRMQIVSKLAGQDNKLGVVVVRPDIEEIIADGVVHGPHGRHLALEPELRLEILQTVAQTLESTVRDNRTPVLLTHSEIRGYLRRLLESHFPFAEVLAYEDIPPSMEIHPLGQLRLAA